MQALMVDRETTQWLVERARGGDREAFDLLAVRFQAQLRDSIRSWSRYRLGAPLDVEEVLQDTFVRAFSAIGRFEWQGDDSFFRWLCGIAKRAVAQAAQEARAAKLEERAGSAGRIPAKGPTQSQAARRNERFDRLERSLEKLRPEHREVLLLSRIEGLTLKEVAERTGRPLSTVKYHLACALGELKKHFGDTESLHLPDRRLDAKGGEIDA